MWLGVNNSVNIGKLWFGVQQGAETVTVLLKYLNCIFVCWLFVVLSYIQRGSKINNVFPNIFIYFFII